MSADVYIRHAASLEHDPTEHLAEHPDSPDRVVATERAMDAAGWLDFQRDG